MIDRFLIDLISELIATESNEVDFSDFESQDFKNRIITNLDIFAKTLKKDFSTQSKEEMFIIAVNEFLHKRPITVNLSESLVKKKSYWLDDVRKEKAGWLNKEKPLASYRTRYLEYLRRIGRADKVVDEVASSSLSILEKIADPKGSSSFLKKGLVVGSVQSGKTGNFNAVINSSIDLGYRMIIVLSGGMEDLRKQTQERIEKEVEGREFRQGKFNGVGKVYKFGNAHENKVEQIIIPTSLDKDFNLGLTQADFALDKINVLVCKKNPSILNNILIWLKRFATSETIDTIPLLIIDDEADNASLNNLGYKGKDLATKINLQIRCILSLFSKASYIGYTATPFANILQDRNEHSDNPHKVCDKDLGKEYKFTPIDNLFPDDFIELLSTPSNYIGPKNFFETKISETKKIPSLINIVNDWYDEFPYRLYKDTGEPYPYTLNELTKEYMSFYADDKDPARSAARRQLREESIAAKKDDNFPSRLPDSLKDAVKCFVITCAVRLKRKGLMKESVLFQKHNTMLVHISRFTLWQNKTTILLSEYFNDLKNRINHENIDSNTYMDLRRIWNKYFLESIENGLVKSSLPNDYNDEFMQKESFDTILSYLINAVENIEIICANSTPKKERNGVEEFLKDLDYSGEAKSYIVIGGNRLSRGFTLEGLTINYFVRDTNYADSLLQMGRWFGYRPGYLDCCKLFTTSDTIESFDFTTTVIEDIEAQFSQMSSKDRTPADFAIKVMNDPDVIKLTRPAILKNSHIIKWSYSNKLDQTTKFVLDKERIETSWNSFLRHFKGQKFKDYTKSNTILIKYLEMTVNDLCDILSLPNTFDNSKHYEPLIAFIKDVSNRGLLNNWLVGIRVSGNGDVLENSLGFPIKPAIRNVKNEDEVKKILALDKFVASGDSSNIITNGSDFAIGLSLEQRIEAENEFYEKNGNRNYPERIYREKLSQNRGVLIIYPIDMKSLYKNEELNNHLVNKGIKKEIPFLGYAIQIPNLGEEFEKEYCVQRDYLDEYQNIKEEYVNDSFELEEDYIYDDELTEYGNA